MKRNTRKRTLSESEESSTENQKGLHTLSQDEYIELIQDVTKSLIQKTDSNPTHIRSNIQDMFQVVKKMQIEQLKHFQEQIVEGEKILKTIGEIKKVIDIPEVSEAEKLIVHEAQKKRQKLDETVSDESSADTEMKRPEKSKPQPPKEKRRPKIDQEDFKEQVVQAMEVLKSAEQTKQKLDPIIEEPQDTQKANNSRVVKNIKRRVVVKSDTSKSTEVPKKPKRKARIMQTNVKAETVPNDKKAPVVQKQLDTSIDSNISLLTSDEEIMNVKVNTITKAKTVNKFYQTAYPDEKIQKMIGELDNTSELSVLPNFSHQQYTYLLDNKMLKKYDGSDLDKLARILRKKPQFKEDGTYISARNLMNIFEHFCFTLITNSDDNKEKSVENFISENTSISSTPKQVNVISD